MDNLRAANLGGRAAVTRPESAICVPFRLQQALSNEANVAGHGTMMRNFG
jgi:hypothetical protein